MAGGSLGTLSRYGVEQLLPAPGPFPLATFLVNISGAFLLGWLLERLAAAGPDVGRLRAVRLTAGTGFLGGFTTYSALAVDAVLLLEAGRTAPAVLYLAATLLLGVAAAACGAAAGRPGRRGTGAPRPTAAPHSEGKP
ncbi:fluoride efflux transporter FluC [Arthrobacter sp. TMN-37]